MGPSSAISGPSRAYRPSWSPLGSILRHLSVTIDEDRRCIADFAKFALRLHESAILSVLASSWNRLGAIFGPSWAVLGPFLLILGPLRATLGRLGPSRREDRRRHSRFSKICISLTREHHFWVALKPSRGDLGAILGHFEAILWLSWPSRGHLASILRHFSVTTSEDGRCIADFAKFALRLHESTIFCRPRRNLWPLESILASF